MKIFILQVVMVETGDEPIFPIPIHLGYFLTEKEAWDNAIQAYEWFKQQCGFEDADMLEEEICTDPVSVSAIVNDNGPVKIKMDVVETKIGVLLSEIGPE